LQSLYSASAQAWQWKSLIKSSHLNSQLIGAAADNDIKRVQQLLEEPLANDAINFVNCYGDFPLKEACYVGNLAIAKLLIQKGADINLHSNAWWRPLVCACYNNHLDIAKYLIENGAQVDCMDNWNRTPLILTKHPEATKFLLSNGASINNTSSKWTPLMYACHNNEIDKVEILLSKGATIDLTDKDGETARDIAQKQKHIRIVEAIDEEIKRREMLMNYPKEIVQPRLINHLKTPPSPEFLITIQRK
jgi:uncharacterized protein